MFNHLKTGLLMGLLMGLFLFVGRSLGGQSGMYLAFGLALLTNLGTWWFSDRLVLAMYRAREVGPADAPQLHRMVTELAARADLPTPRVYVIPQDAPNAFATGRSPSHAAVAVTSGILRLLPPDELRGVLAHELGHIRNNDIFLGTLAAALAGAIGMLASMARFGMLFGGRDDRDHNVVGDLVTLLVAPLAATLIQLAISRSREYAADAASASLVGDGRPLASALMRLESASRYVPTDATPATAHLFIVSPLTGRGILSLFRTHPATEERVRRLLERR